MTVPPEPRPTHLQFGAIALVFLGGFAGTVLRAWLQDAIPPVEGIFDGWASIPGFPFATLTINVVGSFLLGWLVEAFARRTRLRLLLGTGFLGGFTTYSALSADTVALLVAGQIATATLYAVGTVMLGLVAAAAGTAIGAFASRASGGSHDMDGGSP